MSILAAILGFLLLIVFLGYAIIMFVITQGWQKTEKQTYILKNPGTKVSLIVPFRDEEDKLPEILNCLTRQNYPLELFEVILVDDHSGDQSSNLVKQFIEENKLSNFRLMSLNGLKGGKKQALLEGITAATGELIITTDADCMMLPDWIASFATFYSAHHHNLISGPVKMMPGKTYLKAFQEAEFMGLIGAGAGAIGAGLPFMCNGANLAFQRSSFVEVGAYAGNEEYASGDDVFMLHKIKKKYGKKAIGFLKDENAVVTTSPAQNLSSFIDQRARWVSKSKGYTDSFTLLVSVFVYLLNFLLLASAIIGVFQPKLLGLLLFVWIMKMIADLPLLFYLSGFLKRRRALNLFPVHQLVNVFYVSLIGIYGNFVKPVWKAEKSA